MLPGDDDCLACKLIKHVNKRASGNSDVAHHERPPFFDARNPSQQTVNVRFGLRRSLVASRPAA